VSLNLGGNFGFGRKFSGRKFCKVNYNKRKFSMILSKFCKGKLLREEILRRILGSATGREFLEQKKKTIGHKLRAITLSFTRVHPSRIEGS